jgi:tetratricopeptide (TPR) repeat protein
MSGIFISYRRADSAGWAGRLFDHLSNRYGSDLVFQDFDDIPPGKDFVEVIQLAIRESEAMLVVIGPLWLENAQGQRRLDNPNDILRMEITQALSEELTVIPVLVGGASMPSPIDLPEPINHLSRINAIEISDKRWNYDVGCLMDHLQKLILPTREEVSLSEAYQETNRLQTQFFELYPSHANQALEIAQEAQNYLDRILPLYPQDFYLQMIRGYFHKNAAMVFRDLDRQEEFVQALGIAERVFNTLLEEKPDDAGAWNGKGNVAALRKNFADALQYVNRALEIDPNYEAAQKDKETYLRHLND